MGIVGPEQVFTLFTDIGEALGFTNPEKYLIDPKSPEFEKNRQYLQGLAIQQQGQGNPLAEAEKIKAEANMKISQMKQQFDSQIEQVKENNKAQIEMMKLKAQDDIERRKIASQEAIKAAELEVKAFLEREKIDVGKPGIGTGLQEGS